MEANLSSIELDEVYKFRGGKKPILGKLFNKSYRFLSELAGDYLSEKGYLSFKIGHVVAMVHVDLDGVNLNTMAYRAGISKQAMSKIVKELEVEGFIISAKSEDDARAISVKLTEKGMRFLLDWKECIGHVEAKFVEIVGFERLELVKEILGELVDFYEKSGTAKNVNDSIKMDLIKKIIEPPK